MSIPPEVLFHRYLHEQCDAHYRGKYDISGSSLSDFQRLLLLLQVALNEALSLADKNVSQHVSCAPFHVDYIDADVENAIAFQYEGYSFIGLTEPLINRLWLVCATVSELAAVAFTPEMGFPLEAEGLRVMLFRILLIFVVCHEYTHHVHGHVAERQSRSVPFDEIVEHSVGCLSDQVTELDADGYATFLVLNHLIAGDTRKLSILLLKIEKWETGDQDRMLLSCFLLATGAFFFASSPVVVNRWTIYTLEHPPQAARMNCITQQACIWCSFNRQGLDSWMNLERFNHLMKVVVHAIWGMNGELDWAAQTAFFRSEDGAEYFRRVDAAFKNHLGSLSRCPVLL